MPVYNCGLYLRDAIESILNQEFKDFYFHIINDGSTDNTEEIVHEFKDPRIKYFKNKENLKLIPTLNNAILDCTTKYIVRMDGDDIADPLFIKILYNYMEKNPHISICSCYFQYFGGKEDKVINPLSINEVKVSLLFYNPVLHPGIWRNDVIKKHNFKFNSEFIHAEEYEFWTQLSRVTNLANVPHFLMKLRSHNNQVSNKFLEEQKISSRKVRSKLLVDLLDTISDNEVDIWEELIIKNHDFSSPKNTVELILNVLRANKQKGIYDPVILQRKLALKWKNAILELKNINIIYLFVIYFWVVKINYKWSLKELIFVSLKLFR